MNIRFLGAHNIESKDVRPACLLIDNFLAIDAGGLTSSLSFQEQISIKALLITHHHYDHIKDIPMLGMTFYTRNSHIHIYSLQSVYKAFVYLIKYPGKFYTDFMVNPPENPTIKFVTIEPLKPFSIENYKIIAVPVKHSVPAVGYMITSPEGKNFFYTGDTGSGLQDCWQHIAPELLIIEVTAANEYTNSAREVNHLTPNLLRDEMISFRKIKGYLPRIITVHMFPQSPEKEHIEMELKRIAAELKASITTGYEGMEITL